MLEDFNMSAPAQPPKPPPTLRPSVVQATSLNDLDTSTALLDQLVKAQTLYDTVEYDETVEANKKAQVLNTISAILAQIVRMQTALHDSERIKKIEQIIINVMKRQPEEVRELFLAEYKEALANV